jgi:hypothetical protein
MNFKIFTSILIIFESKKKIFFFLLKIIIYWNIFELFIFAGLKEFQVKIH